MLKLRPLTYINPDKFNTCVLNFVILAKIFNKIKGMKKNILIAVLFVFSSIISRATIYTVTNNSGTNSAGSLLDAVNNANAGLGYDTIQFNIGSGFQTIDLSTSIDLTDGVYIDGTSQPGFSFAAYKPLIRLRGTLLCCLYNIINLNSGSDGSVIRGLLISNNINAGGIEINSSSNGVFNCWIGLDSAGTAAAGCLVGITINASSIGNTIGANGIWDRNIISGNDFGIEVYSANNTIKGNYIGTDFNGSTSVANTTAGIHLSGAVNNTIGAINASNLIAGNTTGLGLKLDNSSNTNYIKNNIFGMQSNNSDSLPNLTSLEIVGSRYNVIGGSSGGERNYFCGSTYGLNLSTGADSNEVYGNYFGYTPIGTWKKNDQSNISVSNSHYNKLGGPIAGQGNLFTPVTFISLWMHTGSHDNLIVANHFGTDAAGNIAFGPQVCPAIQLNDASYNIIGGNSPAHRNIIANSSTGVLFSGTCVFNLVLNNYIGTDVSGSNAISNGGGIYMTNGPAFNNIRGNVISGGVYNGITIDWNAGKDNLIYGNKIGTDVSGTFAIPNAGQGIFSATRVVIGSSFGPDRNIISGNGGRAIWLASGAGHVVRGNYIGVAADGITPMPNNTGIEVNSDSTIIGGLNPGDENIIANHPNEGIIIYPSNPINKTNAQILGNLMYDNGVAKSSINIYDTSPYAYSPNDDGDLDTAVNRGQNHPEIKCIRLDATQTNYIVRYVLDTEPNKDYVLEFVADSSVAQYGQGKYFLQRKFINSGATGFVLDSITVPLNAVINGRKISASATDTLFYATSEFGRGITPLSSSFNSASTPICSWDRASVQINPATGGAGYGYTYNFEPGTPEGDFDNYALYLGAGTYTCYVSDGFGCTIPTAPFTITTPPAIVINLSSTPSTCGTTSGSVTANVTGGTGAINYYWNTGTFAPSVSNLPAGRYYFQASDANGCMLNDAINVINTDGQTVALNTITHNTCYGQSNGAIDISVTGGTAPYTYIWSNNKTTEDVNNLTAGYYDVVVRDATGCTGFMNFQINEPPAITISLVNATSPSACLLSDGSLNVSATGGTAPYSFLWDAAAGNQTSSFASSLAAGQYKVRVTDNVGCADSTIITLNDLVRPIILIDSSSNAGCVLNGGTGFIYTSVFGNGPFTYQWSNGATTSYINGLGIGTFGLTVTDTAGCTGTTSKYISGERPGTAQICVLTVDTATNHNVVTWNDTVQGIAEYRIFREGTTQGSFNLIGTQLAGTGNTFVDTLVDANQGPWRYKVQTKDSCNQISDYTIAYKTMRCNVNLQGGGFNVTWDPYLGNNLSFTHYRIFRKLQDSTSWRLIDSVAANGTLSYLDLTSPVPTDTNNYFIEVNSNDGCNSTIRPSENGHEGIYTVVVKSKSNVRNNRQAATGIKKEESSIILKLFPNPASNECKLVLNEAVKTATVELLDITGRSVKKQIMQGKQMLVSTADLATGVYTLSISNEEMHVVKKLVIER